MLHVHVKYLYKNYAHALYYGIPKCMCVIIPPATAQHLTAHKLFIAYTSFSLLSTTPYYTIHGDVLMHLLYNDTFTEYKSTLFYWKYIKPQRNDKYD